MRLYVRTWNSGVSQEALYEEDNELKNFLGEQGGSRGDKRKAKKKRKEEIGKYFHSKD